MQKRILSLALALALVLAFAPTASALGETHTTPDFVLTNVLREIEIFDGEVEDVFYTEYITAEGATLIANREIPFSQMRLLTNPEVTEYGEISFDWDGEWEDIDIVPDVNVLTQVNALYFISAWGYIYVFDSATAAEFAAFHSDEEPTPPPPPETKTVYPTPSTVYVDGTATDFEAYKIDNNNYFKLRDLAFVLNGTEKQFEIGYDSATLAITLTSGEAYTPVGGEMTPGDGSAKTAMPTASTIYLDGEVLSLTVYKIGNNNFFKLRDLMQAIDVYVGYDAETMNITVDTSQGYVYE